MDALNAASCAMRDAHFGFSPDCTEDAEGAAS